MRPGLFSAVMFVSGSVAGLCERKESVDDNRAFGVTKNSEMPTILWGAIRSHPTGFDQQILVFVHHVAGCAHCDELK